MPPLLTLCLCFLYFGSTITADNVLQLQDQQFYSYLTRDLLGQYANDNSTAITEIRMDANDILGTTWNTFIDYPNLTHLSLRHNRLTSLVLNVNQLRVLDVSHNRLDNVSSEALNMLPNIEKVDFSWNNLTSINWENNMVEKINLSHNVRLTDVRINSSSLNVLDLSNLNLTSLSLNTPNLEQIVMKDSSGPILDQAKFTNICEYLPKKLILLIYKEKNRVATNIMDCTVIRDSTSEAKQDGGINVIEIRNSSVSDNYIATTIISDDMNKINPNKEPIDDMNDDDGRNIPIVGIHDNSFNLTDTKSSQIIATDNTSDDILIIAKSDETIGCEFSTRMVNFDDVVMTNQEFFYVKVFIYLAIFSLLVLTIALSFLLYRILKYRQGASISHVYSPILNIV